MQIFFQFYAPSAVGSIISLISLNISSSETSNVLPLLDI
nr:unnamed protein product [Callosobruchus analis]